MWRQGIPRHDDQSGAAAVEFALVLVPLMLILLGIGHFGVAFYQQLHVTEAAREGARTMALTDNEAAATEDATLALPESMRSGARILLPECVDDGQGGRRVVVTVEYDHTFPLIFELVDREITLTGRGVMRCNG